MICSCSYVGPVQHYFYLTNEVLLRNIKLTSGVEQVTFLEIMIVLNNTSAWIGVAIRKISDIRHLLNSIKYYLCDFKMDIPTEKNATF